MAVDIAIKARLAVQEWLDALDDEPTDWLAAEYGIQREDLVDVESLESLMEMEADAWSAPGRRLLH